MYNVLNTHSIGGQRTGRHWQSSGDDLGIHGDIIGYHNYDAYPSTAAMTSYLYDPVLAPISAVIWQNTGVYADTMEVETVYDSAYQCFKNIVTLIFPIQFNPSTRVSSTGYTKIVITLYKNLIRTAASNSDYRYYIFRYRSCLWYDNAFHVYLYNGTIQRAQVWTYDSYTDLQADNYNNYYPVCGVGTWEIGGLHIPMDFNFIDTETFTINNQNRPPQYGGTFSKYYYYGVNDPRNINISHLWGLRYTTDTQSRGYIKYKNAQSIAHRIYDYTQSNIGSTYTIENLLQGNVYSKGEKSASDTAIVTTDSQNILIHPNMTRDYIYT